MKTIIQKLLPLILFSLILQGKSLLASTPKDSLYCIEIDGKVLISKADDSKLYKIELLYHNTLVDSGIVVDDESFLLKIKKNAWYTIRILKEGYYPLLVSIDTSLPEYNSSNYKFHFDTELIQANYANKLDREALEFPIAIISFNPNKSAFSPVTEYSKNIKKSIFEPQPVSNGLAEK